MLCPGCSQPHLPYEEVCSRCSQPLGTPAELEHRRKLWEQMSQQERDEWTRKVQDQTRELTRARWFYRRRFYQSTLLAGVLMAALGLVGLPIQGDARSISLVGLMYFLFGGLCGSILHVRHGGMVLGLLLFLWSYLIGALILSRTTLVDWETFIAENFRIAVFVLGLGLAGILGPLVATWIESRFRRR